MPGRKDFMATQGFGLIVSVAPLAAHRSFEAEYDFNKTVKLTGTVTEVGDAR
jgi:hypothetical protein